MFNPALATILDTEVVNGEAVLLLSVKLIVKAIPFDAIGE